jgi:hypothetical protein
MASSNKHNIVSIHPTKLLIPESICPCGRHAELWMPSWNRSLWERFLVFWRTCFSAYPTSNWFSALFDKVFQAGQSRRWAKHSSGRLGGGQETAPCMCARDGLLKCEEALHCIGCNCVFSRFSQQNGPAPQQHTCRAPYGLNHTSVHAASIRCSFQVVVACCCDCLDSRISCNNGCAEPSSKTGYVRVCVCVSVHA